MEVSDPYSVDFSGDPDDRARRQEERARERSLVRARYADQLMRSAGVDALTADLVLATLFDHNRADGSPCHCGCHPQLPEGTLHDAGFDCSCTWDEDTRQARNREWRAHLEAYRSSPEAQASARAREQERAEVTAWLTAHPGVTAEQTTEYAPEQWQGTVDERSFYFRERHGEWRIELDPEGTVIAEGREADLGQTSLQHLEFIVRTIREHMTREACSHQGAVNFCPTCGCRV